MLSETLTGKPDAGYCQSLDSGGGSESQDGSGEPSSSCSTTTIESLRRQVFDTNVIIGFHGLSGSGKDYSADAVCQINPWKYRKVSFADPIRSFATAYFGYGWLEWKNGGSSVEMAYWGFSPRTFMQVAGEKIRAINPKAFVNSLRRRVQGSPRVGVIHDVRHINEAEMIREEGGVVIGITTDGRGIHNGRRTWFRRVKDWCQGRFRHKTERAIPCDVWVVNDRGEDYEWRLLEAILQAHDQRSTPS